MNKRPKNITDQFGRVHNYLRISLTERCNLRCFYCMPEEGIELSEKSNILTHEEVIFLAKEFVELGVNKIRLTGGEPLIKKNIEKIIRELTALPISLGITTNGILLDKYIDLFKECGVKDINISLDTLDKEKFELMTRRDYFDRVMSNIYQCILAGFNVKINAVLIKGVNDSEIVDFIEFTKDKNVSFRFIEFMPFDGNKWDTSKVVSLEAILEKVKENYDKDEIIKLEDKKNDTTKNYRIKGYKGSFGIISTVSNPFCDSCNRIRLTANGRIKNCLFSATETNLLAPLRAGEDVVPYILKAIFPKEKSRGGMISDEDFFDKEKNTKNRAMISIGG
ncbi:MAG: GTP 3',8-cyclase MoaA [Flavobacteriales bacterium]|nr:GTP 3',8-cyclase MoaA [Flavobacteriales bacterium]